jgi:hypothetical protein
MSRDLPKLRNLGLGPLVLQVFRRSLDMLESSCTILEEEDHLTRQFAPRFSRVLREEFIPNISLRKYIEHIDADIKREVSMISRGQTIKVEDWVFKCLIGGLGRSLWGGDRGPFGEPEFIDHLRIFLQNIKQLNNPLQFLVPRNLFESRRFVRDRLERFSFEEYADNCIDEKGDASSVHESFLGRTRTLCMSHGAVAEGWTDYQLLLITGLGPNVTAAATWLIHHILADDQRLSIVRREIDEFVAKSGGFIDLVQVSEECPRLQATWYEVLRFHGGFTLGRYIREDTTLAGQYLLKKGSYVLAPLRPYHYDHQIWGSNVDEFIPERFLKADGSIDEIQRRNLRVYGVFGTLCPGRYLAVHMAMMLTIRLLLKFDVIPVDKTYTVPAESKDNLAGLPTPAWDVEVCLTPRTDKQIIVDIRFKEESQPV